MVRNRPRRTSASSSLTRALSVSIILGLPSLPASAQPHARPPLPRHVQGIGRRRSTGYSQAHTSTRLAAQAASSATVSVTCTRSQEVCRVIFMARKTSGDSTRGVSHDIFPGIQDSFTTQGLPPEMDRSTRTIASSARRLRSRSTPRPPRRIQADPAHKVPESRFLDGMYWLVAVAGSAAGYRP